MESHRTALTVHSPTWLREGSLWGNVRHSSVVARLCSLESRCNSHSRFLPGDVRMFILTITPSTHCVILICMSDAQQQRLNSQTAGLCVDCLHSRRVESPRGSAFILCELSLTDPAFPKYPRLPVLTCNGYTEKIQGSVTT